MSSRTQRRDRSHLLHQPCPRSRAIADDWRSPTRPGGSKPRASTSSISAAAIRISSPRRTFAAAAIEAMNAGDTHYVASAGIPALRKAIADKLRQDNGDRGRSRMGA